MNKKYKVFILALLLVALTATATIGGLKMQKAYGSTYLVPEDEVYNKVAKYSVSDTHSLYLYESDGQQKLLVKGHNKYGQLGTKDYDDHLALTQILVGLPESKIVNVWALTNASFIQTEDGKLYAAGNNNYGKLGVTTEENTVNVFTEVALPAEAIGHVVDVQGNGNFTIFKTDIGKFYGSGDNTYGQLGLSNSVSKARDVNGNPVVELAAGIKDSDGKSVTVKDMAAGRDFTVLIDDSQAGNIYFTGNNKGNSSNGAKQSATDFLPEIVYGFTFVTNVNKYDNCYFHTSGVSSHDYYISASDENYAVLDGMIVTDEFVNMHGTLYNYVVGTEVFPEVYLFSSIYEDIDVSSFPMAYGDLDVFASNSFTDILGKSEGVHGIKYADWVTAESGDFQVPQSKSSFKLLNEGLLFWLKSKNSNAMYFSYFGKNDPSGNNYIPWLNNTGVLYIEEHVITAAGLNTVIEDVSASQKMLLFYATDGKTGAIFAAGDNTEDLINPHVDSDYIKVTDYNVLNQKLEKIQYPLYVTDIAPDTNSFTLSVGEEKTVSFNSIKRPNLGIRATSNTAGKSVEDIIDYTVLKDANNIITGITAVAKSGGSVAISVYDNTGITAGLFELTFDVPVATDYNISFEDSSNTVEIGNALNIVFLAPTKYNYGVDFELRTSKLGILDISEPFLLGASGDMSRYYITVTPVCLVADTTDIEIWVKGSNAQCVASKTINVTEPTIEKIKIDFAANMPTSINVGDTIDITQYVTPSSEATNMSYSVLEGGEAYLKKISSSIGTFQGMAKGTATIRINHPYAITYKDFTLKINETTVPPTEETFKITSPTSSLNLKIGETAAITYTTIPTGKENQVVISSDDPKVCTVDSQTNKITAVGVGSAYIRLSSSKAESPLLIPVTVTSNIVISAPGTITVVKGATAQIPVSVYPESEAKNLYFTSNNVNVAVSQNGYVTGVNVGTSIITISHPSTNTSKTIVVTVVDNSSSGGGGNNNDNNNPTFPYIKFDNILNKKGELEVVLGGKVDINASIENYTGDAKLVYTSGNSSIAKISGSTIIGNAVGKTTITISTSKNIGVSSLKITVSVVKASYDNTDGEIRINLNEVKSEEEQKETQQSEAKITLKQYQKYKINVGNAVKNVDLDEYFDDYFIVKTTEKYVSYLGNGIIRANYPGTTTVYLYRSDNKNLVGSVKVTISYPSDFFNKMPTATGIPINRTIRITFNQNILSSSVTNDTVFVQSGDDGNGTNLNRTAWVSKNVLYINIPMDDAENSQTKTVYIYILPEVKSTSYTSLYSPLVIPVSFVK